MPVKFLCPNPDCTASFTASEETLGQIAQCQKCGTSFPLVPATLAADPSSLLPETGSFSSGNEPRGGGLPSPFGRYNILRTLGQGGMGTVYLAHDSELDRQVALKVPHLGSSDSTEIRERFLREARAAARFHHANFCPIHDIGQIGGIPYLSMAFIEGRTLSELIETNQPWPARKAAELVRQLALALFEAHRQGVVHRDLKPSNVMVDAQDRVIIMDFGLARRFGSDDATFTAHGAVLGTPGYMPPEQAEGHNKLIGPRSDVYSLGVILYELLTGRRPYEGSAVRVLAQLLMVDPPLPSARYPAVDRRLEAICRTAMAREIDHRFASMNVFAESLKGWLEEGNRVESPATPRSTYAPGPSPSPTPSTIGSQPKRTRPIPVSTPGSTTRPGSSVIYAPPTASRNISSVPFLVAYVLGTMSYIGLFLALISGPGNNSVISVSFLAIFGTGFGITALITGLTSLYRTWELIQPLRQIDLAEVAMPTPGKAVALFFIPFYGWFVAANGLVLRINKYIRMTNSKVALMDEKRVQLICVLNIALLAPCVGYFTLVVTVPLIAIFVVDLDRIRRDLIAEYDKDALLLG